MLRWLLLGLLLFGLGTALRRGWLEVQWNQMLDDAGLKAIDPETQFDWQDFILGGPDQDVAIPKQKSFLSP